MDPRAICRCGRPAAVESIDVDRDGILWRCRCRRCRASFDVRAWERPMPPSGLLLAAIRRETPRRRA